MNKNKSLVLSLSLVILGTVAGCVSATPQGVSQIPVQTVTKSVSPVVTVQPQPQPVQTPAGIVTNYIAVPVTNYVVTLATNWTTQTVTNYTYAPSPSIASAQSAVESAMPVIQTLAAATPLAPVAPLLPTVLAAIFGLTTAASTVLAGWKNSKANEQQSAAAALAATVVTTGQQTVAINHAAGNGSSAAVAVHLAAASNPVQL